MTTSEADRGAHGNVKGALLIARMKFLEAQGAVDRVKRHLSSADRAALGGPLSPGAWYPADLLLRLELTAVALLSGGDRRALFVEMGRFSAAVQFGEAGMHRAYLDQRSPHEVLRRVPELYSARHSTGERVYERTGDRSAVLRTLGGEKVVAEDCLTAVGWLQCVIELSGGERARVVETRCRANQAACCEYACEWE